MSLTITLQVCEVGDKAECKLTPKKLAAFYKAVGGDYDCRLAPAHAHRRPLLIDLSSATTSRLCPDGPPVDILDVAGHRLPAQSGAHRQRLRAA
jgi:hypothetical protein